LQHGLLKSSFVPPPAIRELRDLKRYRVNLAQECNRIANRIQKVLEDASVKLASVATDLLGASGRAMLKALIGGEQDMEKLAKISHHGAQGVCQVICYPQNKGKNILALVCLQSDLSNPSQSPDGKFSREQLEHHLLTSTG